MAGLDNLVSTNIRDFHAKFSTSPAEHIEIPSTQKLTSTDKFDKTLEYLTSIQKYSGLAAPSMLANIGGVDAALSLYANVAQKTKGTPHILFIDRNPSHIDNLLFRMITAVLNPGSRREYIADIFGVTDPEQRKSINPDSISLDDKVIKAYDVSKHYEMLKAKAKEKFAESPKLLEEYLESIYRITNHLGANSNYRQFVTGLRANIDANPKTHYLASDGLYRSVSGVIKNGSTYAHVMWGDITLPDGEAAIRKVIKKYGLSKGGTLPFDIAFIPDLKNSMDSLVPFLRKNVGDVIYTRKDVKKNERFLDTEDASQLVISTKKAKEIEGYKEEKLKRVKIGEKVRVSKAEAREGIPPVLFLSKLDIGSKYCDEKTLEYITEKAIGAGVELALVNGAVYGPFFFWENKRRALIDPEYPTLDAQLRRYAEWRQGFKKVVHIMNDNDSKIIEDLNALFVNEYMRRTEGKLNIGTSVGWQREYRNSRWDDAKRIIRDCVYPFLLYLGEDAAGLYTEDNYRSPIFELVSGFQRLEEGGNLKPAEKKVLQGNRKKRKAFEAVMNHGNDKFEVVHEFSKMFDEKKNLGIRYSGGWTFSKITEYTDPISVPKQNVLRSQNGHLKDVLKEQIIADGRAAMLYFNATDGERVTLLVPGMADDRRYFTNEFAPIRQVLQDPTHKRASQQNKTLNVPGGVVISGDIKKNMTIEPYIPFIIERMEKVQKTGTPYEETVIPIIHDVQTGSITERVDMFMKFLDYAIHERKGKGILSVGDLLQGRNYREMPNENHWLSTVSISVQQDNVNEMIRPFVPYIKFFKMVDGNHEWNSDRLATGVNYHANMRAMFREYNRHVPEEKQIDFEHFEFIENSKGEIVKAPFGSHKEQDVNILFSHMYSQKGSGKGSSRNPVTHLASWLDTIGSIADPFNILLGAHYHQVEMMGTNGRLAAILGSNAGESGFEMARGYASVPMNGLLIFKPDGSIVVEIVSEQFFKNYKPKNPEIVAAGGVDAYLKNAFQQAVYPLHDGIRQGYELQPFYKRELKISE